MGKRWKKFKKWRKANQKNVSGWLERNQGTFKNLQHGTENVLKGFDGGGGNFNSVLSGFDTSSSTRKTRKHKKKKRKRSSGGRKGQSITIHFN